METGGRGGGGGDAANNLYLQLRAKLKCEVLSSN